MRKKLLLAFVISLGFSSCKNKDTEVQDLEKPVVEFVYINGETISTDVEGEMLLDSINELTIVFSDNMELSQSSINIHFVDGLHSHDDEIETEDDDDHDDHDDEHEPFSYGPIISDLEGNKSTKTYKISIPTEVELGDYHLEVMVTDKDANSNNYVYTIELEE